MKYGIYDRVRLEDYLRWPVLSQSVLKAGLSSMAHLSYAIYHERIKEPTDAMQQGSALHFCFLEPEYMPDHVVLWDGERRAGKTWDGFVERNKGRIILTRGMYTGLIGMVEALRQHPFIHQWRTNRTEVACVGDVHGVTMKGRCDALTADPLVDLKKVVSCDPRAITRTVLTYGYHIQAAVYCQLFQRGRFVLLCVEGEPPHDVVPFEHSPAFIRAGDRTAARLLEQYTRCMESGVWPGRSDDVVLLEPPEWLMEHEPVPAGDPSVVMLAGADPFEE